MKTREKTIAKKETKYIGKAQLVYTPSTSFGGSVNDAELHYRGKVVKLEPMTLSIAFDQAKKKIREIDVEIAKEALARWNETARAVIEDQKKTIRKSRKRG